MAMEWAATKARESALLMAQAQAATTAMEMAAAREPALEYMLEAA